METHEDRDAVIQPGQIKYISKKMSYCLRHNPDKYGLTLDREGFVPLDDFLKALNAVHHFRPKLTVDGIRHVMDHSDKQRFEISGHRIRALYGHSVPVEIIKEEGTPPDVLYHGTARRFLDSIMKEGLLPMKRQYVHLSADTETAAEVGRRRDSRPVILKIDAAKAAIDGIVFYIGNEKTWLCRHVPPEYLAVYTYTHEKQ